MMPKKSQPQCTIVDNEIATQANIQSAEPGSTELSGNTANQSNEAEYQCPVCPRTYKFAESFQNYCLVKDGWLDTKNCPIGETKTRGPLARTPSNPYGEAPRCGSSDAPGASHPS